LSGKSELTLRVILQSPPKGVDYGLQKGRGSAFEIVQRQRSAGLDLVFEFPAGVKLDGSGSPSLAGPFVQGPPDGRFVYISIGAYAGQDGSVWSRRLKVPLTGMPGLTGRKLEAGAVLETRVPGTARDGSPACATVKPFLGWRFGKSAA
jgi:hypothetical protein